MKYGNCLNHSWRLSVNSRNLCKECTKEKHIKSAESKGMTIKKKDNGNDRFKSSTTSEGSIGERNYSTQLPIQVQKSATFKKTKINYRSDKGKELAKKELLLFKEIFLSRSPECEYCGTLITVFSPVNYHHVKTKGSHPELRLVESNIVKICTDCHLKEHGFKPRKK